MIGVVAASDAFARAVAELTLSARRTDVVDGAIVVVAGSSGWAVRALAAARAGAVGVVVDDPQAADDADIALLQDSVGRVPVVLHRPRLRADVVADAARPTAPRHVTAEVAAEAAEFAGAVRDAIGWLRVLTPGELVLSVTAGTASGGVLALLEGALPEGALPEGALREEAERGRAATLTATIMSGAGGARIRAHAIGEERVEVVVDAATGAFSVDVATASGVLQVPRRHESPERIAVRRAIDAVSAPGTVDDLRAFRHDVARAAQVLDAE